MSAPARIECGSPLIAKACGDRCPHCLGVIALLTLNDGRELVAELVGDHYERHDCLHRAWHAVPAGPRVY